MEADKRENELDELAKTLNNDRVKLAEHNETIRLRMDGIKLQEEELDQREADLHSREMSLDSADSQTSDLELALLKQKVEIYEKLIFGERRITI